MIGIYIILIILLVTLFYLKNIQKNNNPYLTPKKNIISPKGKNSTINGLVKNLDKINFEKENSLSQKKNKKEKNFSFQKKNEGFKKITNTHIKKTMKNLKVEFDEKKKRYKFKKSKYIE